MGNLSVIGKVHIKDINALREWHASGDFKKWHKVNWSPELAAYHHIKWEDTDQIAFYQMQNQIAGLPKSLDRTDSWMSDLLEMAGYLQSIGQSLNLLYLDDQHRFAIISGADINEIYTLPCRFLDIEEYKDYSDYTPDQMCSIAGETASSIIPAGQGFSSVTDVKEDIYSNHFRSGIIINWYKHLGRTNTCNKEGFSTDDLIEFLVLLKDNLSESIKK